MASRTCPLMFVTMPHRRFFEHTDATGRPHAALGRLVQPEGHYTDVEHTDAARIPWGADNACFRRFDRRRFVRMLDRLRPVAGAEWDAAASRVIARRRASYCRFVAVPDVVGDAVATARRFEAWAPAVARRGLPVALVLQDGIEHHPDWLTITLTFRVDAVFVGGSDAWKLGPAAAAIARHARSRGRWVHWGRVNTLRRIRHVIATGACDSFDGTGWALYRDARLDWGLAGTLREAAAHRRRADQLRMDA
ncbi:hypothetical protein Q5424_01105 [Conexibacter sp. JD483]|uniref:hypothetical protein n=1 Tax=unclassified Conexibacter TaxID=2627773 RepID=UPI00271CC9B2|nr:MULTISPECIES: hypothetical protein [unclassified Conexibacter]MDO8185826.1 hypothetical protein [Conexibacter sp. CPCC 205706]MDO8198570.1 hypothetical protein [Conexibacter sp. CPCC 205762]MDR9367656.1 hypothetical protein [Conexibacter sp. JD483]